MRAQDARRSVDLEERTARRSRRLSGDRVLVRQLREWAGDETGRTGEIRDPWMLVRKVGKALRSGARKALLRGNSSRCKLL